MARPSPLALLLAFVLLLAAPPVGAGEEPASGAAPAEAGSWDAERFWFADLIGPARAWERIVARVREAPRAGMRALQREMVETYLDVWKGDAPAAEDRLALATMYRTVERPGDALTVLGGLLADDRLEPKDRTEAALQMGTLIALARLTQALDPEEVADRVQALRTWLAREEGGPGARASVLFSLADHAAGADDRDVAIRLNMEAARTEPGRAAQAGRTIKRLLMASELDLDGYDALRERASSLFGELRTLARGTLDALPEEADPKTRERAESVLRLLEDGEQPFEMLGRPAPAWTLEHAFSDVRDLESLRGKVVVLDFWATWCGWCIKSFPAIRDLLREYEDRGLVVVGVTTTHRTVYGSRFDLDDDMADKAKPGEPVRPVAVLAGGRSPGPDVPVLEGEAYRAKEREVLEGFIAAHAMTWPVVMIDSGEPKERYALMGWPHAVVLDREGRVRFFKSGALLRDRPEEVAHFREKLEKLLAEGVKPEAPAAEGPSDG